MRKPTETPIEITFLLFERFSNLCLANCLEPMRAANGFLPAPAYRWRFVTLDGGAVRTSSDLPVLPDGALAEAVHIDRLFVLASYDHLRHDSPATRRALARAGQRADEVIGLDAGAWLMAGAGLLRDRRATIHWDLAEAFSERFLDVTVLQEPHLRDGDRVTCAGAMAAFDMTRAMIRADLGQAVALDVDGLFLTERPSPQGAAARGDPLITRATALMRTRLEAPLSLEDLSRTLGTTPRTLTRRCRTALDLTPGALYRHLRLSAARQMVESSTLPVSEVALRCGYEDPTALTRAFRTRFKLSPQEMRRRNATLTLQ